VTALNHYHKININKINQVEYSTWTTNKSIVHQLAKERIRKLRK